MLDFNRKKGSTNPLCSLYLNSSNKKIPLLSLNYKIEIIDSLAFIKMSQKYQNTSEHPIETEFLFSLTHDSTFLDFEAILNDRKIKAIVKEKDICKAEYLERLEKGQFVAYTEIDENVKDITKVKIGNIPPKENIDITITYIQKIEPFLNKFRRFCLPSLSQKYGGDYNNIYDFQKEKNIDIISNVETYKWNIEIFIISTSKIIYVESPSHKIEKNFISDKSKCDINLLENDLPNKDFILLFKTENIHKGSFILEHLESDEEFPYVGMLNMIPEFNKKENDNNVNYLEKAKENNFDFDLQNIKGEFIFFS